MSKLSSILFTLFILGRNVYKADAYYFKTLFKMLYIIITKRFFFFFLIWFGHHLKFQDDLSNTILLVWAIL